MKKKFVLKSPTFSINAMYGRDQRYKRPEATEWAGKIFLQLSNPKSEQAFNELRAAFDPMLHSFHVYITAFIPESKYYTKDGNISAATHDCSNFEKPLVDLLFDKQYHAKSVPYGCMNLNINDKYVSRLVSQKLPIKSEQASLEIVIKIVKKPISLAQRP